MLNREAKINELISFAINNLFFYGAKSITFDVKGYRSAQALLIGCDGEQFPHLAGKIVKIQDGIDGDTVYETAKYLIEQKTTLSRPELQVKIPYDSRHGYIGLRFCPEHELPCPLMISSVFKGQGSFYLQFTAQNLEKKLEILRSELKTWNANMASKGALNNIATPLAV